MNEEKEKKVREEEVKNVAREEGQETGEQESQDVDARQEEKGPVELEEEITSELLEERINSLEEKLEKAECEKDNYYKQARRLKADFVNYRKRATKEKASIDTEARIDLICKLLPVVDNFERALDSYEDGKNDLSQGVEMIYRQLLDVLKQEGLSRIEATGEEFDPCFHEAVMQVEDTDEESGIVVEELEKGYMFDEKVVRPARVKVAK